VEAGRRDRYRSRTDAKAQPLARTRGRESGRVEMESYHSGGRDAGKAARADGKKQLLQSVSKKLAHLVRPVVGAAEDRTDVGPCPHQKEGGESGRLDDGCGANANQAFSVSSALPRRCLVGQA